MTLLLGEKVVKEETVSIQNKAANSSAPEMEEKGNKEGR
jgi:hypothetical protein